jgi:hypothetical protein
MVAHRREHVTVIVCVPFTTLGAPHCSSACDRLGIDTRTHALTLTRSLSQPPTHQHATSARAAVDSVMHPPVPCGFPPAPSFSISGSASRSILFQLSVLRCTLTPPTITQPSDQCPRATVSPSRLSLAPPPPPPHPSRCPCPPPGVRIGIQVVTPLGRSPQTHTSSPASTLTRTMCRPLFISSVLQPAKDGTAVVRFGEPHWAPVRSGPRSERRQAHRGRVATKDRGRRDRSCRSCGGGRWCGGRA